MGKPVRIYKWPDAHERIALAAPQALSVFFFRSQLYFAHNVGFQPRMWLDNPAIGSCFEHSCSMTI
jgi:hypothetical protein